MQNQQQDPALEHIGWQEWCSLKGLEIPAIKAKIDTGAKTSAIHAVDIKAFTQNNINYVSFTVYPLQRNTEIKKVCTAPIVDKRRVMSSNGIQEERYVIRTPITMGSQSWEIELTLSDRDPLRFRILLGREALRSRVLINPEKICCLTKISAKDINSFYYGDHPCSDNRWHAELE